MRATEQQKLRIKELVRDLRKVAAQVGPLHSYWDLISDLEAIADDKKPVVLEPPEWHIAYAEQKLNGP